jgi:ADP-ribose pyrophosphatase
MGFHHCRRQDQSFRDRPGLKPHGLRHNVAVARALIERIGPPNAVYSSRYGCLYDDAVAGPSGRQGTYLRWEWESAGVVIAPTDGQRLYLWPMYRYPIGSESLEFPRGAVEPNESVADAAVRELAEETGFVAVRTAVLGCAHADTGLIAASSTVVLAYIDADRPGQPRLEATEAIAGPSTALTARQMSESVRSGAITCALTIAAFVHALPYLGDRHE